MLETEKNMSKGKQFFKKISEKRKKLKKEGKDTRVDEDDPLK